MNHLEYFQLTASSPPDLRGVVADYLLDQGDEIAAASLGMFSVEEDELESCFSNGSGKGDGTGWGYGHAAGLGDGNGVGLGCGEGDGSGMMFFGYSNTFERRLRDGHGHSSGCGTGEGHG